MRKLLFPLLLLAVSCNNAPHYQLIIRNGLIYDGTGGMPYKADIAVQSDTIALIGNLQQATADTILDAQGLAVAPGFINMLSWANETLIADGRAESDVRQGVTLEVMGEGSSMGPLNQRMAQQLVSSQGDITYPVTWNSFGGYFDFLVKKGISVNVASFLGAGTVRNYVIGEDNRPATPQELDTMRAVVRKAMEEGAMGIGSSLIYPPDFFADTKELIVLCTEAGKYGGMYISHMRSEGNRLHEAVNELITIARASNVPAEIYHLKAAGKDNWPKIDSVIRQVENARSEGLAITADMYLYPAGATGLTASFPPTLQDGGFDKLRQRLQDPFIRAQMKKAMQTNATDWENLYYGTGSPEKVLLLAFKEDSLKKYTGKSLAAVAAMRGTSPEETAMDLIVQDNTRVGAAYFLMHEDNIRKQAMLPWMSFGSDEGAYTPEGVFLQSNPHPRAYGNVARLLGKYVREEKLLSLEQAIYKLTKLPASNLKLVKRGELKPGNYADIVIFDQAAIKDNATFEQPHQFATGVRDVLVNGTVVLQNNKHTGAMPGRFIKGPGAAVK